MHNYPAPDHAPYQGRQYSFAEYEALNNSLARPISTCNCYHSIFSIILGLNSPTYSEEQLAEINRQNAAGIEFEGRHYTMYEATQMQRKLETAIRTAMAEHTVFRTSGDRLGTDVAQLKITQLKNKYVDLSKAAGLSFKAERLRVDGYKATRMSLTKARESDIINILPQASAVIIPPEKFTKYALNPLKDKNKAEAFQTALGYSTNNTDSLIENIKNSVAKFNAIEKTDNGFGKRYEVIMTLTGENGKKANVKTGWILDKTTGEMRLTSAYVTKKKFKE